ncbi:MAG TPA: DNA glycosylase, partial [Methanomicrobiales archaeon]|nr:DNA glycosylase [Methanomicrobiales archaeon]
MSEIHISQRQPLHLDRTLRCGQVFRWEEHEGWWYGMVQDSPVRIRQEGSRLIYEGTSEDR